MFPLACATRGGEGHDRVCHAMPPRCHDNRQVTPPGLIFPPRSVHPYAATFVNAASQMPPLPCGADTVRHVLKVLFARRCVAAPRPPAYRRGGGCRRRRYKRPCCKWKFRAMLIRFTRRPRRGACASRFSRRRGLMPAPTLASPPNDGAPRHARGLRADTTPGRHPSLSRPPASWKGEKNYG